MHFICICMRWLRLPVRRPRHEQGTSYTLAAVPRPPIAYVSYNRCSSHCYHTLDQDDDDDVNYNYISAMRFI